MRLHFFGVWGSTPAPGREFSGYGGHTSCVGIARGDEPPRLVLDAGTGLQRLTAHLAGAPFKGTLLLGHLHWDHTHGLPFFAAGDRPDAEVTVHGPVQDDGDLEAVLERMMSPPHFPIRPSELRGDWNFSGLEEGHHRVEGFDLLAREIPHKGGRTYGYRVGDGRFSLAYLSDHSPTSVGPGPRGLGEYHDAALELADGVDVLIHDAQNMASELTAKGSFGHAAAEYAIALGERAGARRVVLFHHDPTRTDAQIDALVAALAPSGVTVWPAREGAVVRLDCASARSA